MANTLEVKKQLHSAGFRNRRWGWSAVHQLPMILEDGERIERAVTGGYDDGYVVVLATNRRVLLLDKKPFSFKAEDVRYEMVSEVEHYLGPFVAKIRIHCLSKSIEVTSVHHGNVQAFAIYVDQAANQARRGMSAGQLGWNQAMMNAQQTGGTHYERQEPVLQHQNFRSNQ